MHVGQFWFVIGALDKLLTPRVKISVGFAQPDATCLERRPLFQKKYCIHSQIDSGIDSRVAQQIFYLFLGLLLSGIATAEGLVPIQFK